MNDAGKHRSAAQSPEQANTQQPRVFDAALAVRAIDLYLQAGRIEEAQRLCDMVGERFAGPVYERQGDFAKAAQAFERANRPADAARCWLELREYARAARNLRQAGEAIAAAWLWAHRVHSGVAALAELSATKIASTAGALAADLVRARCDVLTGDGAAAALRLRTTIEAFRGLSPGRLDRQLVEWGVAVAECCGRPDLALMCHAAAAAAVGDAEAKAVWDDSWAAAVVGGVAPWTGPSEGHAK